ncbi:uncharacterized protein L969DRAFT_81472 [Mixia osmundae IAM 14324]|uniref:Malonyl-CoA:ACP transacylase (MAT) domain-containing protein n=1 Tax=Mixia osmundae (strain CBS 9802 / IAM 14324 / JCM 22182 / KY 12970) TaxID=764103 RepID=G7DTS8_MIXOS|nr:uncharacterized protein L969DRAFT_81472 [Mixia osmundae IAM 14324]KEI41703.1 hypothetical protein L969DRAFT_81472 [Mixia osmundae IAM 14324]GAA93988.1 hypothetical protein E5Q_00635 [Mixia osmundae IAM 14324]
MDRNSISPEADQRPLVLHHVATATYATLLVSAQSRAWTRAEILREAFTRALVDPQAAPAESATESYATQLGLTAASSIDTLLGDAPPSVTPAQIEAASSSATTEEQDQARMLAQASKENAIVLHALFLRFIAHQVQKSADALTNELLLTGLASFIDAYLCPKGTPPVALHTLVSTLDAPRRQAVLRAFYEARQLLQSDSASHAALSREPSSRLWQASSKANIYAVFGGQGTNEVYFEELQLIYDTYRPLVQDLIEQASQTLCKLSQAHQKQSLLFVESLDAHSWLLEPATRPPVPYLASCAVSLPLIGLTQLAQYAVTAKILNLSPDQMLARQDDATSGILGLTGHSQGVVSATVTAMGGSSWAVWTENALKALEVLFFIGLRGSEAFSPAALPPAQVQECIDAGEGAPTPMLAVTGLDLKSLQKRIDATNNLLKAENDRPAPDGSAKVKRGPVAISLFNGIRAFVVTGPVASLTGLVASLRKAKAEQGKDQSKTPFSKRLPVFSLRFLPIGVPYHSDYLAGCTAQVVQADLGHSEHPAFWQRSKLRVPVFNTETGKDLREGSPDESLLEELCHQIFTAHIHWTKATHFPSTCSHVIDFGPGGLSGIGSLTARGLEGRGVRTLLASGGNASRPSEELYHAQDVRFDTRWIDDYAPKLLKTRDGKIHLDTPFSRLLSKPPLMVAGMTPSTVKAGFNAATMNAGYHIELAGGGHYNEAMLRAKVAEISSKLDVPGLGITLNSLYINPRAWTLQFPLWCQMRKEGLPVEGLTVAAGIPSTEKAAEIIHALREAGIKHVSFKPGSSDGIRQVINIAAANPDYPIIMQWTGGRAGGHHSPEDFHDPIIRSYGSIRAHKNLILVGGSGFGSAEQIWPYLSGDWSQEYGVEPMPYDGFLFASWMMVALEAHTSDSVKQLILDAPGVDDDKWEGTYDRPTGGILTVRSELGEPIHKIATRGVKLWRKYDDTVFGLPKEKRVAWLLEHKAEVIAALNADFQKPWFPAKADGTPCDLGDMTYEEVLRRMTRLLYVAHQKRWIDKSHQRLVGDWIRRTEERLSEVNGGGAKISALQSYSELDEPEVFLDKFLKKYSSAQQIVLASEDVKYFVQAAQRPGQKPVPFIPVLDSSFEVWFKKDSLWQAEDIDAVFDQDPQRVCILQGPVAAKYCTKINEPVKTMLGDIERSLTASVIERFYAGDESKIPVVDYIAAAPALASKVETYAEAHGIRHRVTSNADGTTVHDFDITQDLPPQEEWLGALAGQSASWLRVALTSQHIVQGRRSITNPISRVFVPRKDQRVRLVVSANGRPCSVKLFGAIRT